MKNWLLKKKDEIDALCNFCEIEFVPEMLNAKGKGTGYSKTLSNYKRNTRWKSVLRRYERFIIDSLTSKSRKKMNYI